MSGQSIKLTDRFNGLSTQLNHEQNVHFGFWQDDGAHSYLDTFPQRPIRSNTGKNNDIVFPPPTVLISSFDSLQNFMTYSSCFCLTIE